VAGKPKISLEEFFEGVAEMRAHLDRTGASRARGELTRMAMELVRPRASFEAWLCDGLRSALEARGVALVRLSAEIDTCAGEVKRLPKRARLTTMLGQTEPISTDDGTLITMHGVDGPVGALWLERHAAIDAQAMAILQALLGAAAVML
jgi:hypothetical protein